MRILDLYAGLGGESRRKAIEARGHTLVTLDLDPAFNCTITADMMTVDPIQFKATHGHFDFIWASPPCFTGDQLVLTLRGHVPIENIRVGDMVLTHLCRWRPVTAIGRKKVNVVKVLRGYGTNEIGRIEW